LSIIGGFGALFEAKYWEEVGRMLPTPNLFKPKILGSRGQVQIRGNDEEFDSQSHFYAGKPLRRGTLWAISGSFTQPISVPSVVLGS
jgi:hypothetical protein